MIIIDKRKNNIKLLLTLTEKTSIENSKYLFVLQSLFDKTTNRFILPDNTSLFKFRYDEFSFTSEIFKPLMEGFYSYSIYQTAVESMDEKTMGKPIETGLVKVIDVVEEKFISVFKEETADDFIIYEGS